MLDGFFSPSTAARRRARHSGCSDSNPELARPHGGVIRFTPPSSSTISPSRSLSRRARWAFGVDADCRARRDRRSGDQGCAETRKRQGDRGAAFSARRSSSSTASRSGASTGSSTSSGGWRPEAGEMAKPAAEFTLHCFAQSGNAYKPALALELAGADWTPHFVDYFDDETRATAFRELNVMGEVPVLEHRRHAAVAIGRDSRLSGADARPVRGEGRCRGARDPALAPVGQPQADELYGDVCASCVRSSTIRSPPCWPFCARAEAAGGCSTRTLQATATSSATA